MNIDLSSPDIHGLAYKKFDSEAYQIFKQLDFEEFLFTRASGRKCGSYDETGFLLYKMKEFVFTWLIDYSRNFHVYIYWLPLVDKNESILP